MQQNTKKAFTLLELMVSMGIISVLVGLSLVGIQTVQRSLRNTQRNQIGSDLQKLLEDIKLTETGEYPQLEFGTTEVKNLDNDEVMQKLEGATKKSQETNPTTTAYCYEVQDSEATYSLGIQLEGRDPKTADSWRQFGNSEEKCVQAIN